MQLTTQHQHYHGYAIIPSAFRLPDGWFAANLLLCSTDTFKAKTAHYKFDALDYFDNEIAAIKHAVSWARAWVDDRG